MRADLLATFLGKRPNLSQYIVKIQLGEKEMELEELLAVLPELPKVNLNYCRHRWLKKNRQKTCSDAVSLIPVDEALDILLSHLEGIRTNPAIYSPDRGF